MLWPVDDPVARHLRATLPGERGLPIVGHTLEFIRQPIELALRIKRAHGPIAWGVAFGQTNALGVGPDVTQTVLRDTGQVFANGPAWGHYIGKFFPRGLMLLDGDEHKLHRGVMSAAFKRPVLERYFALMQPSIARAIGAWTTGATTRIAPLLKQLTLDVATEVFMGETPGPAAHAVNRAFIAAVRGGTAVLRFPIPGGRWAQGLAGRRVLERFIRERVPARRARPADDLFSRLCEASDDDGNRFTDDDVVNHMIFLMMAAHDTSTITLTSMLYQLAKHPTWQERVRAEASAIGPTLDALDVLERMPSLDLVMKESMRLLTPLHVMPRRAVKDFEILGHKLLAGTNVILSPAATHRLPEYWSDPDRFDPERFDEARAEHKQHPFLFTPFGGGAHRCIGATFGEMEIKAIAHLLLTRYRLSVPPGYELPIDYTSLPTAADGLPVQLARA